MNNIDEIVPSIMMKIGIKCSFVSLLFFFKEPLHFCLRCPFTLCGFLIDTLPHGFVFKAA